jgi:hypothetical protein
MFRRVQRLQQHQEQERAAAAVARTAPDVEAERRERMERAAEYRSELEAQIEETRRRLAQDRVRAAPAH